MMGFGQIMILPFLACLVLTGIHAYFGLHVIRRQVIFVDLALAQIAVLGMSVGILFGFHIDSGMSYALSLIATVIGAALFAVTRFSRSQVPHEAIIGIIYVVASALGIIVLGYTGEGTEHIHQSLVGNILLVAWTDIAVLTAVYVVVGGVHIMFREPFLRISDDPERAAADGLSVTGWDFLFYVTFGIVVTSSVKLAGVLLVFTFLVIPAVCGVMWADGTRGRLLIGWAFGLLCSACGIAVSYILDIPTGAAVVVTSGFLLLISGLIKRCVTGKIC